MNCNYITLTIGMFLIIGFCIIICIFILNKKNLNDKKKLIGLAAALMLININISFTIPYHKLLAYDTVEEGFKFIYPQGKIIAKKEYKNVAFVYGANVYKSEQNHSYPGKFLLYVKKGSKWKIKHSGEDNIKNKISIKDKESGKKYDLYIISNKDEKITGIYITNFLVNSSLSKNTKITDSYNTTYEGIEGLDSNAGKFSTYMFFGILSKEITDDYYINIDGTKYVLSDYVNIKFL